ncbi:MAG: InlB B-repeat-containing protein, partial [Clostridia bacterium]|nr:InlB B-repeat-containing protein [Clostridia bacterium]
MGKKTTKRISVWTAILLAFAMLFGALVFLTGNNKAFAFADGEEQGKLLYILDTGRINDTSGGKLGYDYNPETSGPAYVDSTVTFIKRNGGTLGDIDNDNGTPLTRLLNSYTDHPFGEDPKTGKYWGFNEDYTTDMPHRLGRAGEYGAGYSEFRSVNDEDTTDERLTYKFEVPDDSPLDVTVMTCSPSNWGEINGKMSVNGGSVISLVAQQIPNGNGQDHSIPGCQGVLNSEDGKYYLTLTFGEEGAQTVVNGIIIREKLFTVSYTLNGGTNNAANKSAYKKGEGFTLADPTRTGYPFAGWYKAGTEAK